VGQHVKDEAALAAGSESQAPLKTDGNVSSAHDHERLKLEAIAMRERRESFAAREDSERHFWRDFQRGLTLDPESALTRTSGCNDSGMPGEPAARPVAVFPRLIFGALPTASTTHSVPVEVDTAMIKRANRFHNSSRMAC
jgi:hypothetical protein